MLSQGAIAAPHVPREQTHFRTMTTDPTTPSSLHRIVIVGGGAGGLELATRLGDSLGKRGQAEIVLVDVTRTHLWKPLLHEVAAGSINLHAQQLDYLAQARWHHFIYVRGAMNGLNRANKEISVAPVIDDDGIEILPTRTERYDTLVMAVGSISNDFGTPGVAQHAFMLDSAWQAHLFHRKLVNLCFRANFDESLRKQKLNIVIVGAGATGVELSAELHNTTRVLAGYGLKNLNPEQHIHITLIEAGPRILPGLPEHLSEATHRVLERLNVLVLTNEKVVEITGGEVKTASGKVLPATLAVWAAGIRCHAFLKDIDGLETNRINQLVVRQTLQATRDDNIFALGDCAACPWVEGRNVPPRAQAAHQQASLLVKSLKRRLRGEALPDYHYRDFGSLVSLGNYSSVGNLMGFITGKDFRIEGWFAKLMYISLYKLHLLALHGFFWLMFDTLAQAIKRQTDPHVKLH